MKKRKIDIVYLWCDGRDPEFKKRKNFYETQTDKLNDGAATEERFFDNEELKYSLRSLEKYAPWINHVFIVTDRQIPKFLNLKCSKVSIVDHSEIMPKEIIPCFNSTVLEYFLPYIPNLQEKFLYANDDCFFGGEMYPEDFFVEDKPIVRVKSSKHYGTLEKARKFFKNQGPLDGGALNANEILFSLYRKSEKDIFYVASHNIDAYSKHIFLECNKKYEKYIKSFLHHRFREGSDIQRLFTLDLVYSGEGILKDVTAPKPWRRFLHPLINCDWECYMDSDQSPKLEKEILKYKPKLFCINSGSNTSLERKKQIKNFMEQLFPEKSMFEN